MRAIQLAVALMAILFATAGHVQAGVITVSNLNTDNIIVPVFDNSLGTLDSVELTVTLRSGVTGSGGSHAHSPYTLLSTNTRNRVNNLGTFSSTTGSTTTGGSHVHSVDTPSYSAGGIDIGQFALQLDSSGDHLHNAQISFFEYRLESGAFKAVVNVQIDPISAHSHTYSSQVKNLAFSGDDLTPFLGPSEISILGGEIFSSTTGSHVHTLPAFSVTIPGPGGSDFTWQFASSTVSSNGAHFHTLTPKFDTVATFHFTEVATVPEPSTLAIFGIGASIAGTGAARRRRRVKQQEATA